ncbi:putative non-ribosomal peptide synthetase/polyketide synthase [Paenibacillus alvei TS-15]|uniref:Phenolphthiocerol/phthiocerol polyketide synthase subunit E n=1 Tax=Paenibacillus alvei TS-15 TaxID=1117108 RepID=S9SLD6_PAEAL|nr:hybrid non-ribosomal peptide synthetase/type I polyketide synthase [Paenibacillus alvei]EPY06552.1 putative non-ribosomal peptide synthetase/polyketide synthase [Paenibacillus alvei TS-15]
MVTRRLELTEVQKGIFFDCQIDDPLSYNITASIMLEGVNEARLEQALNLVIEEQEALRCSLDVSDEMPLLVVHERINIQLTKLDFSAEPELQEERVKHQVEQELSRVFDLTATPLFHTSLIKLSDKKHIFLISIHHIISDGLSLEVLKQKLMEYDHKLARKEPIDIQPNTGFTDFMSQENTKLAQGGYDKEREYWAKKMVGAEPLALPNDFIRHQVHGGGKEKRFEISSNLLQQIHKQAREQEVTTFMFVLAAFGVLMNRYTQQEDVVFSSPFSYRPDMDFEESIGCFVYMLPMRLLLKDEQNFSEVLQQVSKELIEVYKHIGYPNNLIMRDNQLLPLPGTPSIFDVSFVYDIVEDSDQYELKAEILVQDRVTFPGSLMVILQHTPHKDLIKLQYKPELFADETIDLLGLRFMKLLELVSGQADIKIGEAELLLDQERSRILQQFNQTSYFTYEPRTIIELFHTKVAKHLERKALIDHDQVETYASVDAKANQLARNILQKTQGTPSCIGIQLERSANLVISLLAVLKAGCAYVPIDPTYPSARKQFIFEDANVSYLITTSDLPFEEEWKVDLIDVGDPNIYSGDDSIPEVQLDPYSLAYIMYTSGSTGKPKGVMVENHSVVNTLLDLERRFPVEEHDLYLLKTPHTFDVSGTELFGWFMGEGSLLVLEPDGEKNPQIILEEIHKHKVTHINFVPTMFRAFLELLDNADNLSKLASLKWICIGGEAVTPDILHKFNSLQTDIKLENVYGPTECTIWASHYSIRGDDTTRAIPIGEPLNETRWYIVGKQDQLQPIGIAGELCLSGVGLARGYLNRDELTKEKFVANPFYQEGIDPDYFRNMYRTGDLARWLPSGTIEFLGRIDFQEKVRGVRLETGEIENVLSQMEGITQAIVVVKKETGKSAALCAYYLSDDDIPVAQLKEHLSKELPAYMIPSFFVHKRELPLNTSGKVNRNALIADKDYLDAASTSDTAPNTDLEVLIASVWQEVLGITHVGVDDSFFEIGGHSIALIQMHNKLKKALTQDFPITMLFQYPTVRLLADHFNQAEGETITDRKSFFQRDRKVVRSDIAIIGMSIHAPGASNIYDFWNNLKGGVESIHFYKDEELLELGIQPSMLKSPNYIKAKGRIDGIDEFDASFFEYTPGEVQMMSPQLRLLYQGTWEALEDAGYYPGSDNSKIGLFLGGSDDFEWYRKVLFGESGFSDKYQAFTLSTNHFLATRIAYKLDIKGPVYSALTGCSTTLVTPHLSCQSLILGECDIAVAGGITIELPNEGGYYYEEGMMFSPDGHCRPFDAKAKGTMFSNGMGLVVLKRLDEAIEDGDHIYAVIKGSAINNDGRQKIGFVAPSVEGQAEVIQEAYRVAGIDPETITYVEAHGTGTALGDPIEVESLTKAFASEKKQFCTLGSVKGNVGHTDTAAGVVGLAKVALSLEHKYIPPTVNYTEPNPKIDFASTPFTVQAQGMEWMTIGTDSKRRAGINSFGVGGTNAHMVLEEAPSMIESGDPEQVNLLVFSAKSKEALANTSQNIVQHLIDNPGINVTDAAWTLQVGRKPFAYRKALVVNNRYADDPQLLLKQLQDAAVHKVQPGKRQVYFLFPGQGSQYQGMGRSLYRSAEQSAVSRIFKRHMDHVLSCLTEDERLMFEDMIYGDSNSLQINQTENSQFALFATSYSSALTMLELGVKPAGMIGHSIGELAAATVAGVFELKDAVEIVRLRGRLMQQQEPGVMLAVMATASMAEPELIPNVWIALENTTNSCVVGGREEAIAQFEAKCEKLGWKAVRVKTSHAFHTPMMEEAAREFEKRLSAYRFNEPRIPIVSNVSGEWVSPSEMNRPSYWAAHILRPVNFAKCLTQILKSEHDVFIEVGAGRTLSTFARQHESKAAGQHFVNLIRHPQEALDDVEYIHHKLGLLWGAGVDLDWKAMRGNTVRKRVSLPTYVFDKGHFPIGIAHSAPQASLPRSNAAVHQTPYSQHSQNHVDRLTVAATLRNQSELEQAVLDAYKSVFGFDTIASDQDFFSLGGDSLKAVSLAHAIQQHAGIKVEIVDLFTYSSPSALVAHLHENSASTYQQVQITPAAQRDYYPLSSAQNRMYALHLLNPSSVAYNLPSATKIRGLLDRTRVEQTLEKLMLRHESLRTSFDIIGDQAGQIIHDSVEIPFTYREIDRFNDEDIMPLIRSFIKPFSLESAPLFRVELIRTGSDEQLLLFDMHHSIADGTSMEIITRDFNALYFGELTQPVLQYKDYAVWQAEQQSAGQEIHDQRAYWLQQLDGELPALELPTDYERPSVKDFHGDRIYFHIEEDCAAKLIQLAQETGTTLYMMMLSAWYVLLARYSGQEDIIVGTPVAGRTQEETKETVGMFVNMLAMRNRPLSQKSFAEFLHEVKENALKAFSNQDCQFDELVDRLHLQREFNRNPLFDVCFDFQNMEFHDLEIDGILFAPYAFPTTTSAYDLVLTCQENKKEKTVEGFLEFATGLFRKETVQRMIGHFQAILQRITTDINTSLGQIDFLTPEEKLWIVTDVNHTALTYDENLVIVELFEQHARTQPDKPALIVADGRQLTYREVNEQANAIAHHLIEQGVTADTLVGVMPRRDEYLIVSLLAVLKAGGAYVPIDPAFPKERITYMLTESNVNILLCPQEYQVGIEFEGEMVDCREIISSIRNHNTDDCSNPVSRTHQNNLACVIFTSGSTGKPKGVMINQGSILNFIQDIQQRGVFQHEEDRVICVTTLSFDIFAFESIVPLCTGHSVYIANENEQLDPMLANEKIVQHKVTHLLSTVSRIKAFVENPDFAQALKQLTCILSGGENYPDALLKDLQTRSKARLFNMYGPTETTIWSVAKELTASKSVTIGQPIANTQAYIISDSGLLQPVGVYGELCLAGHGLARGYLNNPEETKRKFFETEQLPGCRLYRTGDRGRLLANGEIELMGRLDSQIKVRGYRVELDEIEKVVQNHEHLRQAVAVAYDDKRGNKQLGLYCTVKKEADVDGEAHIWLKPWLREKLPHYMIPGFIRQLEEMPTLPNGKIDKKALPLPQESSELTGQTKLPSTGLEKAILDIWKDVLGTDRISVRDNFFDVGGNSLGLILINNRINSLIGRSIPLMQLFQYPTIESLVKSIGIPSELQDIGHVMPLAPVAAESHETADIAVIGMAGRFPGAPTIDAFWDNIVSGVESVAKFSDEELLQAGVDADLLSHPKYVKAKGYLDGIEYFDSAFFDYPYQEANMMDPQIRLLHECVWEVLENGGYNPSAYKGLIGLFAGSGSNLPWMIQFLGHQQDLLRAFEAITLNEKDFLTTRVSYKLNLKGPSFNVQTACSTSLVAIHQAVQSLQRGESHMAIAGGVSISYPRKEGYLWHEGMIFSQDGHCKPFAEDSSGTVSGNGCGVVLLKPLAAALRDGDHIYGVIKGSAMNNDGLEKIGYTAPSVSGQAQVIQSALRQAGVSAEDIHYVEAHGTGTKLGDPIEIEALKQAWDTKKTGYCAIGSVKANIGHLDSAAGVAGFIKTVLSLYHRTIPPLLHFTKPNPAIDFANSPFYVNTQPEYRTDRSQVLRAGVSSFGIGGTNVHVVLEQPPEMSRIQTSEPVNLLLFSARSQSALTHTSEAVLEYLHSHPAVNLSDAAWTLQTGRKPFEYRKALVINGALSYKTKELQQFLQQSGLRIQDGRPTAHFYIAADAGAYRDLGRDWYTSTEQNLHPLAVTFNRHVERVIACTELDKRDSFHQLQDNPALEWFAVSYGIAMSLIDVGVLPDGLFGQGIGEVCALTVAGVLALEHAVEWVQTSGKWLQGLEEGALEAVVNGAGSEAVRKQLLHYPLHPSRIPLIAVSHNSSTIEGVRVSSVAIGCECSDYTSAVSQHSHRTEIQDSSPVHMLPAGGYGASSWIEFQRLLAQLWCEGFEIDWSMLLPESGRQRIPLPTYVFDATYHEHDVILNAFELKRKEEGSCAQALSQAQQIETGQSSSVRSRDTISEQLAELWQELLGCGEVKAEDDFFVIGGHSLKAISLSANIQQAFKLDMSLTEIFDNAVFDQMVDWIWTNRADEQEFMAIQPVTNKPYYEVSSAQKRMFAVHEMVGDAVPYNLASVYVVEGQLDKARCKSITDEIVQRHESLRTRFQIVNGEVVQIIEDEVPSVVEFNTTTEEGVEAEIKSFIRPFDLAQAPLLRVRWTSIHEEKHILLIDMHHIISDQYSIAILLEEMQALYAGKPLTPLSLQYKDFAAWQNEFFKSEAFGIQLEYWKEEFAGEIPTLNMMTDYVRPPVLAFSGDEVEFEFGEALSGRLEQLASERGLTPYMILMAVLKLVLWKITGQQDLIVGTGIAGRRHTDLDPIVGMFVNTLAIRSQIDESLSVGEYLQYIKEKMLKAYENQDCQFEMLLEGLHIEKNIARNPLFDVIINFITMGTEELELDGLTLTPRPLMNKDSKFDLTWTIEKRNNRYVASLEYNTSLFTRHRIESYGTRLLHMLTQLTEDTTRRLSELTLVTPQEREWLLHELNPVVTLEADHPTLAQLFEEQVELHGQRPAIVWNDEELTYAELNSRANRLATCLADMHVHQGDHIAILLERGPLQIVSILAILKLGCAYVPIDPDYPQSRIAFMLEDSGASLILTDSVLQSILDESLPRLLLDREEGRAAEDDDASHESESWTTYIGSNIGDADDTAYIMYTSGSTGTPKGVLVSHRNVARVVKNANYVTILHSDRMLQLSNYAFDGSVFDIFGAILNGACLVIISKDSAIEIAQLAKFIEQERITAFFITSALFNMLVDWDVTALKHVRKLLIGGEAISIPHARKAVEYLGPDTLINGYGPTETTVFAAYYPIGHLDEHVHSVPIGYPLSQTKLYILDQQGQLVPPYVPGELYIGGAGVSKGYLNRDELTAQRFVNDPFDNTGKLYRTGDLVWRLPTGEIGFIGRLDFQVKIRGFRIELGEVENHIQHVSGVKEAVVLARTDRTGSMYMVAYYTVEQADRADGQGWNQEQMKALLREQLPAYMIPARLIKLERMPLNINGKIDRQALTNISENEQGQSTYAAPRTEVERTILRCMQEVLDQERIGITDDFFEHGGHSIKAIALVQALLQAGLQLKVNEIFMYPTVEQLAALPGLCGSRSSSLLHKHDDPWREGAAAAAELSEQQIQLLVQHVRASCSLISTMVASADRVGRFPLSPVQLAHGAFGAQVSGFVTPIHDVDEKFLRNLLVTIIQRNQLLHSVMEGEDEPAWSEYDSTALSAFIAQHIPYIDLRTYHETTKQRLVNSLTGVILSEPYIAGNLPWRLCCLRVSDDTHQILWGFDHIAFDGMSAEVVRRQIEQGIAGRDDEPIQPYADYVTLLSKGPVGITEQDIIEYHELRVWKEQNSSIMDVLLHVPNREVTELELSIPIALTNIADPWGYSFDLVGSLLRSYTGITDIPLAMIHYGRSYQNQDFYNSVGEFLDIIPVLLHEGQPAASLHDVMQHCRRHSINFLSLLYHKQLSGEYVELASLLDASYRRGGQAQALVLYNFQGYASQEEIDAFRNSSSEQESSAPAQLSISVNYDKEQLRILLESPLGLNADVIQAFIRSYLHGQYTLVH